MRRTDFALLMVLALVWGASFLFIKMAVETIPPALMVCARLALAALIVGGYMRWKGIGLPRDRRLWAGLAFVGLINSALPYTLFAWGEQYIPSGLAAIFNATTPLWVVLLAQVAVPDERLTPLRTAGVVLGFGGVVWLVGADLDSIGSASFMGQLACLFASACYAVAALFTRRKLGGLAAPVQAFGQLATGALWLLPLALATPATYAARPSLSSVGALLALSIAGTGFAMLLFFHLLKSVGATRSAQVTYLLPVFGLFWGWLILSEPIKPEMVGGLLVIMLGVLAVNGRLPVWNKARVAEEPPTSTARMSEAAKGTK